MHDYNFCLFTSGPIDHWDDFTHLSKVHEKVLKFFKDNPYHDYTYHAIWSGIMKKIHWAWCVCKSVDRHVRSFDVWVDLNLYEEAFEVSILFKSDNNGTVNLIIDNSYDINERVKLIRHEFGGEWEFVTSEPNKYVYE